ncbi:MAG: hypothetical protein DWC07_07810 [Candidatus Poseidoniales archaeon]|nr:MAG: hypothetical protein DWC07_07810 [Candidatus Poseidoniales archaeon]
MTRKDLQRILNLAVLCWKPSSRIKWSMSRSAQPSVANVPRTIKSEEVLIPHHPFVAMISCTINPFQIHSNVSSHGIILHMFPRDD